MDKRTFTLINQGVRIRVKDLIDKVPEGYWVVIREPTRSLDQNAKAHSMIGDISNQVTWKGMDFSREVWKRLLMAAFLREHNEQPLLIPALDGNGVDIIFERTSQLGVRKMAAFIEWIYAFGTEHGVVWSEPIREE